MLSADYITDIIGIGFSAAINIGFYVLYNKYRATYLKLQDAKETELTPELIRTIKNVPGGFSACVYGAVMHSNMEPIRCEAKPSMTGVIHTRTIMEHIVTKLFGMWVNDTQVISSTTKAVPFMLHNNGIEIKIENPAKLEKFDLVVVNDVFEPVQSSMFQHLIGWMKNVQRTGIQEIEEMLLEGSKQMAIGRIISRSGVLYLVPEKDLPYIITTEDREDIIEQARSQAVIYGLLRFLSSIGIGYMIYRLASNIMKDRKRKKDIREMKRQYEARLNAADGSDSDVPTSSTCVVCFNLRDVVLIPCGHFCVCSRCAWRLDPKICPMCRERILFIQEVYTS